MRLEGQVAIVTGASQGVGKAIAMALAREGARLALAARSVTDLEAAAAEIENSGAQALPVPTDVTLSAQADALVSKTIEAYGQIDILVNNVGGGLRKPIVETTDEEWQRLVDENLTGTVYCCRAVIPIMRRQSRGSIVNISSRAGRIGEAELAAYCAVKHGVVGLTRALAAEEGQSGIRVNAVCPGPVATERMARLLPDVDKSDWLLPEEVAEAVLFLATSPGRGMQGKALDLF